MKKKICLLLCLLFAVGMMAACGESEGTDSVIKANLFEGDGNKEFVKENDSLKLAVNASSTAITVTNKKTGKVWTSNPTEEEIKAAGGAKGKEANFLKSTMLLKYSNKTDTQVELENYTQSIANNNYTIEQIDNGIQVNYSIGEIQKEYCCPIAASETRLKQFTDKMDKSSARYVMKSIYEVYDYDMLEGSDLDEALAMFPNLKDEKHYRFNPPSDEFAEQCETWFKDVGYTEADYLKDKEDNKTVKNKDEEKPVFNISIQYVLDGDQLKVTVPMDKIQYRQSYPIIELSVLPYMGTGSTKDNGFVLVPEGTGGIINFNNGKTGQQSYVSNVYGWDYGISRDMLVDETKAYFPLFGICKNGTSMMCISEEGSSYAVAKADISGKGGSNYNYGYFTYNMVHGEDMDISSKSDTTVRKYEASLPKENLTQRYIFTDTDKYSKMAEEYRTYMMKKYPEMKKIADSKVPMAVELIGAVDNTEHILGYPVERPQALTKYEDAKKIMDSLLKAGVDLTNLKYTGWFNGGVKQTTSAEVSLIGRLGSSGDLEDLAAAAKKSNVNLYMDGVFGFAMDDKILDGFVQNRDAAKFVSREITELYDFWPVTFRAHDDSDDAYYLLKPQYTVDSMDSFVEKIKEYGTPNISLNDVGNKLGGDYNPKDRCSREKTMKMQMAEMSKLQKNDSKIMIQQGNSYAVPYSDMVVDMDLNTKKINLVDETVPFYTMALHGLVNYSGDAVNIAEDYEQNLLRTVETGGGLYYVFMNEPTSILQDGSYTKFFACNYDEWKKDTIKIYQRFKTELGDIYNQYMVEHQKIADGVYMTEYENGKKVYVNYNYNEYNGNGIKIPARDFTTQGGGK